MRPLRSTRFPAGSGLLVAALLLCALALSPAPDAGGASPRAKDAARADRHVVRTVKRRLGTGTRSVRVRCSIRRRGRALPCTWTARRTRAGRAERCGGRYDVRVRGRKLRAFKRRLRCVPAGPPPVAAPTAPPVAPAAAPVPAAVPPPPPAPAPAPSGSSGGGSSSGGSSDDDDQSSRADAVGAPAPSGLRYFGFNDNSVRAGQLDAEANADLAAGAGANMTRVTFDWRYAENRPGEYDFSEYDAIYAASLARGIRPLWIVMFAPRWAWAPGTECAGDCRLPPGDEHLDAWKRLVARIADRYPESAGIEVWNEPNLAGFWRGGIDPERYARLLAEAYAAVQETEPSLPVVGASVSNNQVTTALNMSMRDFLARLYAAGGADAMDALSVHAYPWSLDLGLDTVFGRTLDQVRALRDAEDEAETPLWITETGLSTSGIDLRYRFSEREQADGLVAQYRRFAAASDVEALGIHTLLAQATDDASIESGYGVLRADRSPRPAYCALARERSAAGPGC